jgi:hypothetical protein
MLCRWRRSATEGVKIMVGVIEGAKGTNQEVTRARRGRERRRSVSLIRARLKKNSKDENN